MKESIRTGGTRYSYRIEACSPDGTKSSLVCYKLSDVKSYVAYCLRTDCVITMVARTERPRSDHKWQKPIVRRAK